MLVVFELYPLPIAILHALAVNSKFESYPQEKQKTVKKLLNFTSDESRDIKFAVFVETIVDYFLDGLLHRGACDTRSRHFMMNAIA